MRVRLSKQTALATYYCCRQGERSVHYLLSCPTQWTGFHEFYDHGKQQRVTALLDTLHQAGGDGLGAPDREDFSSENPLRIFSQGFRLLSNQFKKSWVFSRPELSFLVKCLEMLLDLLRKTELPCGDALIDLRLDLYTCGWLVAMKLAGLPALREAEKFEHFLQSDFREHKTLEQMEANWS